MKAHPLSLIEDNEDNSSQTYISSAKAKKSLKEDDVSTENTLNNLKKYNIQEKPINLIDKTYKINHHQRFMFDFKNKFAKENSSNSKKTCDTNTRPGLIDDTNEDTKKETSKEEKINDNHIPQETNSNIPKDKLANNLIEKRDKRFSYHGKIYFFCAVSMLLYQFFSYIYLIEFPIIERK